MLSITLVLFSLSGSFYSETDKEHAVKLMSVPLNPVAPKRTAVRVCIQHAEQANCPFGVFPCSFTMVAASRSLKDVDELCSGGLICVVAEFLFGPCRHSICTHHIYCTC